MSLFHERFSETPTRFLKISWTKPRRPRDALTREALLDVIHEHAPVTYLSCVPHTEGYGAHEAFATFKCAEDAVAVFDALNGTELSVRLSFQCAFAIRREEGPDLLALASKSPHDAVTSPELEKQHVHQIYDIIAPHFSHTRRTPWPVVKEFLEALPVGSVIADVGCGNGKAMATRPGIEVIGCDMSLPLLNFAGEKGLNVCSGDVVQLPFKDQAFDAVICVAVLHHLSTEDRRIRALKELCRIVAKNGRVLVQVWAKEQDKLSKRQFEAQDTMVPWCLTERFVPLEEMEELATAANGVVDTEKKCVVFQRFCHVFLKGELGEIAKTEMAGKVEIEQEYWDKGNWGIILKRLG